MDKEIIDDNLFYLIACFIISIIIIFNLSFYSELEFNKADNSVYIQTFVPIMKKSSMSNFDEISYFRLQEDYSYRYDAITIAAYSNSGVELFNMEPYYKIVFSKSKTETKCSELNSILNGTSQSTKVKLVNEFAIILFVGLILMCILFLNVYLSEKKDKRLPYRKRY